MTKRKNEKFEFCSYAARDYRLTAKIFFFKIQSKTSSFHVRFFSFLFFLINFNCTVNLSREPEARQEPDCSSQEKEERAHDERVRKVQKQADCARDVESTEKVDARVQENIQSAGARSQERSPPPAVVFRDELKIRHHNRDLGASDNENHENKEQEGKPLFFEEKKKNQKKSKKKNSCSSFFFYR